MTSLALSFNNVNFTPVEQQDGQIWLTASELTKALEYKQADAVTKIFNRNSDEFNSNMTKLIANPQAPNLGVRIFSLRGAHLVAMFARTTVAKLFRKWVLDILDREVLAQQVNSRQAITPEQQNALQSIVARRSGGCIKARKEMWTRHNNHFKIGKYVQLLSIHFDDSVRYLEAMEIKAKAATTEVKALPYPQEVIAIAQQISNEFKGGRFNQWFVCANNGVVTAQPIPYGHFPALDLIEFTKRFDNLLDLLYGSDVLRLGRTMSKNK